jgi:hypothetical protein
MHRLVDDPWAGADDVCAGADNQAPPLLLAADRKPEFYQCYLRTNEHVLDVGTSSHKLQVIVWRAKTHDPLDTGAVVPRAIEEHDFSGGGQWGDVSLKVPLGSFALDRFLQGDDTSGARIDMPGETLDRAAFARRVTSLEQNDNALPGLLDPALRLELLALKFKHVRVARLRAHEGFVGILAGLEQMADGRGIAP